MHKRRCHVFVLVTGEAWTEEEHKKFLLGLNKLGKGDWRGISRNYVVSRTPTQVASHAQKYFNRQTNVHRRKRRSSLFDMVIDDVSISLTLSLCTLFIGAPLGSWLLLHNHAYYFIFVGTSCVSSSFLELLCMLA